MRIGAAGNRCLKVFPAGIILSLTFDRQKTFLGSLYHSVVRFPIAQQQRGHRIVPFIIIESFAGRSVGVTVFAAVHAGVVCADVPAFNTMAALAHPLMF